MYAMYQTKIFDGEMSITTLPTTLLQIICKTILNFKVIAKSTKDPDDNFWRNSLSINGLRATGKCTFDREMSITTLPTTLLQIVCKTILNFKVIAKSTIDPDDNFWRNSLSINGLRATGKCTREQTQ